MKLTLCSDHYDYNSIEATPASKDAIAIVLRIGCRTLSPEFRTGTASKGLPPPGRKLGPSESSSSVVPSGCVSSTVGVDIGAGVVIVAVSDVPSESDKVGEVAEVSGAVSVVED